MKINFFVQMGIHTAVAFAETLVDNSKADAAHKAAAERFIAAAEDFISVFAPPPSA